MDNPESWYKGNKADFMQHNQLALVKQAFSKYFHQMPVGISLNPEKNTFLVPFYSSVFVWPIVQKYAADFRK